MSQAWFGFLGVVVGAVIAGAVSLLGQQLASRREREARQALREQERQDRRDTFERETLLALQDALADMRQAVFADYQRKIATMAEQGPWPVRSAHVLLPDDWGEADDRLIRLYARVFDEELQMAVEHFRDVAGHCITAQDQAAAFDLSAHVSSRLEELNARIGVLLSRLF